MLGCAVEFKFMMRSGGGQGQQQLWEEGPNHRIDVSHFVHHYDCYGGGGKE